MVNRAIRIRYINLYVGLAWTIFKPLILLTTYMVVFAIIIKIPHDSNLSYGIYLAIGIVIFNFTSQTIGEMSVSHVENTQLLKQTNLDKYVIPISFFFVGFFDFLINNMVLIFLILIIFGLDTLHINFFVILSGYILLSLLIYFVGLAISCLMILYRDIKNLVPLIFQILFFATPITYDSNLIPQKIQFIYYLNPLAGLVDFIRFGFGGNEFNFDTFLISCFVGLITCIISLLIYFKFRKIISEKV